jgi:hypothetical protein
MSALTVYQGLESVFRGVDSLRTIMLGEPTGDLDLPGLYTAFESFDRPLEGRPPGDNVTGMTYRFVHRLMIQWVDFQQAEMQLLTFINKIPFAVASDPQLGGRITSGVAKIVAGDAGFVTIGGVKYRVVDFRSETLEKGARSSGL